MPSPTQTSVRDLLDHYETFFLDAYGVLVTGRGPLQGAAPFIELLRSQQKSFSIVTNDASRLPSTCAARYQELGIQIDAHEVLTSGSMITEVFKEQALAGAKTMVLGTDDTRTYVTEGGGHLLELKPDESPEVVVVADEGGYNFLRSVEAVLSALCGVIDAGNPRSSMSQIQISSIPNEKANLATLVVLSHSYSKPGSIAATREETISSSDLVNPTRLSSMRRRNAIPRVSQ